MNLSITLAGDIRAWRPWGAAAVEAWLRSKPWHGGRQPLLARVPWHGCFDVARAVLGDLVGDSGEPGRPCVDVVGGEHDPRIALTRWMGIEPGSRRELAEALGRLSEYEPRILVVEARAAQADVWLEEAERLTDLLAKVRPVGRVGFLIVVDASGPSPGAHRLDIAWPADPVRSYDDHERWSGYVHERVAWHCGGRVDLAQQLDPMLIGLRQQDDVGLEDALDHHAGRCLDGLAPALRDELVRSLRPVSSTPELQAAVGFGGPDAVGACSAPWLARGLLRRVPAHPARRQLQSVINCRPLAARLLSRCLALEQQVTDAAAPRLQGRHPKDEVFRTYERLQKRPDAIEHRLTPRGRRDLADVWDLASLGDVLDVCPPDRGALDPRHELRRVRNALAHGSPVGWAAVAILDHIEASLR